MAKKLSCTIFLSHQYRAAEINVFFYGLFASLADLHFEVDAGDVATNVTRLERKLRKADAFVGIYPSSLPPGASIADLRKESRYFRLEVELATRSRKPALVLYDERYKDLLLSTPSIESEDFDSDEILNAPRKPSAGRVKATMKRFIDALASAKRYDDLRRARTSGVGVMLPSTYPKAAVDAIAGVLTERHFTPVTVLPASPVLSLPMLRQLHSFDFLVADVGDEVRNAGVVGYAHGQFIPMIRLRQSSPAEMPVAEDSLFGGVEVGYAKDVIRWESADDLVQGFQTRLQTLEAPTEGFHTPADAEAYFRRTSLRQDPVFVSYSGDDREMAAPLIEALKRRFKTVFDYRDGGESIPPGSEWLPKIFESAAKSVVAVLLLSKTYLESGNCAHEARALAASKDDGRLKKLFPIWLRESEKKDLQTPDYLSDIQYLGIWNFAGADQVVAKIVEEVTKAASPPSATPP